MNFWGDGPVPYSLAIGSRLVRCILSRCFVRLALFLRPWKTLQLILGSQNGFHSVSQVRTVFDTWTPEAAPQQRALFASAPGAIPPLPRARVDCGFRRGQKLLILLQFELLPVIFFGPEFHQKI